MKAIGLLSGGLDSQLAIRLMLAQGIEIVAMHFRTIFCNCTPRGCSKSVASNVACELDIQFKEIDNTKEFLEVVKNPPHGYGSGMNPCIDCRILMFKKAKKYMDETGAGFIFTGEVLGQRPMSQHTAAIRLIEKESDLKGLIVRPLSAQLLPETIPEQKGWIDRGQMLDYRGRSRRFQILLAEKFNMRDYPCAAGGCLLTDPGFSSRISESFKYGEDSLNDVQLLKVGRHFRLLNKVKLVVGRNEMENKRILNLSAEGDILIEPLNVPGPSSLLRKNFHTISHTGGKDAWGDYLELATYISAGYCDGNGDTVFLYGMKDGGKINWDRKLKVKVPTKPVVTDDYCRRI